MTDQRDAVREAYDAIADDYLSERSDDPDETALLDDLLERLSDEPRVLDAGCGAGTPVLATLADDCGAVGVDFSREQVRRARENVPGAAVAQQDVTALGLAADSFDAVCAYHSIIHVPVDEHPDAFAEFARVLRPGGWLLVSLSEEAWEGENDDWLGSGVEMRWSFPDLGTSREQLREAGFEVVRERTVPDELGSAYTFVLARRAE